MNRRLRMILMGIGLVVFAALIWFLVLSPIRSDIADTKAEIEDQQEELMLANSQLARAKETQQQGKANQARLMELAKMMPESEEIPSLLLQLQDLADQSGILFVAISPGTTEESDQADYRILPLDLEFEGTFFDISDFIYRTEKMVAGPGRLLAIKNLELSVAGEGEMAGNVSPSLGVTMTMYAFLAGGGATPAAAPAATTTPTTEAQSQ